MVAVNRFNSLTSVDLASNEISEEGIRQLSEAIRQSTNLRELVQPLLSCPLVSGLAHFSSHLDTFF